MASILDRLALGTKPPCRRFSLFRSFPSLNPSSPYKRLRMPITAVIFDMCVSPAVSSSPCRILANPHPRPDETPTAAASSWEARSRQSVEQRSSGDSLRTGSTRQSRFVTLFSYSFPRRSPSVSLAHLSSYLNRPLDQKERFSSWRKGNCQWRSSTVRLGRS